MWSGRSVVPARMAEIVAREEEGEAVRFTFAAPRPLARFIAPKGSVGRTIPDLDLTTDEGVLIALASPNLATRYMAMARLNRMKPEDAVKLAIGAIRAKPISETKPIDSGGTCA